MNKKKYYLYLYSGIMNKFDSKGLLLKIVLEAVSCTNYKNDLHAIHKRHQNCTLYSRILICDGELSKEKFKNAYIGMIKQGVLFDTKMVHRLTADSNVWDIHITDLVEECNADLSNFHETLYYELQ